MDKKRCGNTYRGILLSHKKEWDWIICRDMDRPRDCHTDWRKSERDKQISYINAYIWNLGKWYTWYYLQSKNRDTEVQNKHLDTRGGRETGVNWETEINLYTWLILCIKSIRGFPGGASGKGPTCQCRRCKRRWFYPWVGNIPWRMSWQPTTVFLPGVHRGAWWSIVYRVAKSQMWLKRLKNIAQIK